LAKITITLSLRNPKYSKVILIPLKVGGTRHHPIAPFRDVWTRWC